MLDKEYDVFIAYHGSHDKDGSKQIANLFYKYLKKKGIKAYFFPADKKDSYKTTILEVMKTKTFILLCTKSLGVTVHNRIDQNMHYQLLSEIDTFYALTQTDNGVSTLDAKILACGEFGSGLEEGQLQELHQLFSSRTHESCPAGEEEASFDAMYEWIVDRTTEWGKRVDSWKQRQVSNEVKHTLASRSSMNQFCNLANKISSAKVIKIAGITNLEIASRIDENVLFKAIQNGAKAEIIFLDPDGEEMQRRMVEEGDKRSKLKRKTKDNIEDLLDIKFDLSEEEQLRLHIYKNDLVPRMNMIIVDDFIALQYYANFIVGKDNPCFLIEKQDVSPLYDFCISNFETMKERSTELDFEDSDI